MLKRTWADPVWSKVIAGVILAAGGSATAYLLNWWPIVGGFLKGGLTWALASRLIPHWVLVLLVLLAMPVVIVMIVLLWERVRPTKREDADWRTYTKDEFFGLRWRWKQGEHGIYHLATFCPHCDYQVLPADVGSYRLAPQIAFHCEQCGAKLKEFDVSWPVLENRVERLIDQKLRNSTWPKPGGV